jgi:xanthine/CO dehydrogenase XdhC/CoxF family maturation factor
MLQKILEACALGLQEGRHYVLASVVYAQGSTYRGVGARLLIGQDFNTVGEVSGGCLDGDLLYHAKLVFDDMQPRLRIYDYEAISEDSPTLGAGFGCMVKGLTKVLLEPITPSDLPFIQKVLSHIKREEPFILTTMLGEGATQGIAQVYTIDGVLLFSKSAQGEINGDQWLDKTLKKGFAYTSESNSLSLLTERIDTIQEVLIIGSGDDVLPLLSLAELLGWRCRLIDSRKDRLDQAHFLNTPKIYIENFEQIFPLTNPAPNAFVLIMTHHYLFDKQALASCMNESFEYIGLMGPRAKSERMLKELKEEGMMPSDAFMSRFHSPMGLDMGSESSQEVALSIMAELIAVKRSRAGGKLRDTLRSIHDR